MKEIAKSRDVQAVTNVCASCKQLEFDHKSGSCTRLSKTMTSQYTIEECKEISKEIMKDVVEAIEEEVKTKLLGGNQQVEASKFLVGGEEGTLASAFKDLVEVLKQQKQAPTQVTKVKVPPTFTEPRLKHGRLLILVMIIQSIPSF